MAAAAICLAFVSGGGIVYAADLGGVQRKIQLWVQGDQTDADIVYNANGSYDLWYENEDGTREDLHGGGVAIEADGTGASINGSRIDGSPAAAHRRL